MDLEKTIRDIPDFPKKGIIFKDITTLLKDPAALKEALDQMYEKVKDLKVDKVVAMESRGFIFGVHLAYRLNAGFVPIRKPGKLPAETIAEEYALEYGTDKIEIHKDALSKGDNVLIVDDLLATGGTAKAAANLVKKLGANVTALLFLIELGFLQGREKLVGEKTISIIKY
jgi:adenine phosphoribosyltransferase